MPPNPQPISNLSQFHLAALSLFVFTSSSSSKSNPSPRRFLKESSMSISNPRLHPFSSPQSLADWLKPRLPTDSFASWGVKPGTKNIHNLWLELSHGETSLADSTPPVRTLHVLSLRILDPNRRFLIESHQQLSDGTFRVRNRPLSEKLKPNETPESAVVRAVKEELGSVLVGSDFDVRIVPDSYRFRVEERDSVSYPGLPACYVLHSMDVCVEGLPEEGEFCTVEDGEYGNCEEETSGAVSVKKHFWKWVSSDSVDS